MALPDDLRQAVLLHYAEGMSPSDIARINAEAPSTVTRRLDKARTLLRQHLESGLATSLAATARAMRPAASNLPRTLAVITAAAAIPAATRAQLLHATADTPPPPMIDKVTSAANAAPIQEAGIMSNIIAKVGAAKLIVGAAAIAAVGGGAFGVKSLVTGGSDGSDSPEIVTKASMLNLREGDSARSYPVRKLDHVPSSQSGHGARIITKESAVQRMNPAERVALLRNDLISTNPVITTEPGETTGTVHFDLEVVNQGGLPVPNANVSIPEYGFETGAFFSTISLATTDTKSFSTNANGIARVTVPSGPSTSGSQSAPFQTSRITAVANHPDYAPTRQEMDFTSITKLVLTSGNILEVLPLDGTTSTPIRGKVEAEFKSPFVPEQYTRPDGTVVFRKIAENNADFILKYRDASGILLVSDRQSFPLPAGNAAPVLIPLHPTLTLMGRLDDSIPRPVTDIEVKTHFWLADNVLGLTTGTIPVAADGTFIINNIPEGTRVSVAALGKGYCAVTSRDDSDNAYPYQVKVEQDNQPLTLPMERTANGTLQVKDPDGEPVIGARISASVSLMNMGDYPRWGGPYTAVTDEHGMATIKNIPPLKRVQLQMQHPELQFPKRESKLVGSTGHSGLTRTFGYNIEVDMSRGGEFFQKIKAEVKPPEKAKSDKTLFLLPEGSTLTYTFPPKEKD